MFSHIRAECARVDSSRARDNCALTLTVTRNYRVLAVAAARTARSTFIDSIVHYINVTRGVTLIRRGGRKNAPPARARSLRSSAECLIRASHRLIRAESFNAKVDLVKSPPVERASGTGKTVPGVPVIRRGECALFCRGRPIESAILTRERQGKRQSRRLTLTLHVEDEQSGLRLHQVRVARLTDQPRLQMLPADLRIRQVVHRHPSLAVVVIRLVYHGVVEIPREFRRRPAAPHLADQVHVAALVVPLLDAPNAPRRAVQYYRFRGRHCARTGTHLVTTCRGERGIGGTGRPASIDRSIDRALARANGGDTPRREGRRACGRRADGICGQLCHCSGINCYNGP